MIIGGCRENAAASSFFIVFLVLLVIFVYNRYITPLREREKEKPDMDMLEFLKKVTAVPGVTGNEGEAARFIAEAFRPLCDEVTIDRMNSVICHKKGSGPRVIICAHLDEIGMMVSKIEEDGCLRLKNVGGVDPRVLPGMRVRVYGTQPLTGVMGAKAPHLLSDREKEENYTFDTLFVDMGMSAEKVKQLVRPGDTVCFEHRYTELKNGFVSVKTCDDRACVAMMLGALQLLQDTKHEADLWFVATCQEEIGSWGAMTSAFGIEPEWAVAFDVCHALMPGSPKFRARESDSLVVSKGPYLNPLMVSRLEETAEDENIRLQTAICPRSTATDADELAVTRGGIPAVLISLPLRYMHTNVETCDTRVLKDGARLLAAFLRRVNAGWEDELWN